MRIEDFRSEKVGNRSKVSAKVKWEDCSREDYELYFETEEAFAADLTSNPHAFLIASSIPALHYGEKRIAIDAEICPELLDGLQVSLGWLSQWHGDDRPTIETRGRRPDTGGPPEKRAGSFFSGGIDSYATISQNRLNFPLDHPRSIKDGILVFGLEQDDPEIFEYVQALLAEAAEEVGINLISVYTNLYLPFRQEDSQNSWHLWLHKFMGAALAAVAHALGPRFSDVSISPSFDIPNYHPHGNHPLLVPNYGSCGLRIHFDGTDLSRFEKTKLIVEQGLPLSHLRVCNKFKQYEPGRFNCCKCEKCVRTMLELMALGALKGNQSFAVDEVTEEMVEHISIERQKYFYEELLEPLKSCGLSNLADLLEKKLAAVGHTSLKKKIKEFDHRYLHDGLRRLTSRKGISPGGGKH